jgi:hypothetical protein
MEVGKAVIKAMIKAGVVIALDEEKDENEKNK